METFVIRRRNAWGSAEELEETAARSTRVGDEMSEDVRWIRSYVLEESDGSLGSVCIYQGSSEDAVREHASRAEMPADEVTRVADTVVIRPDPEPATA